MLSDDFVTTETNFDFGSLRMKFSMDRTLRVLPVHDRKEKQHFKPLSPFGNSVQGDIQFFCNSARKVESHACRFFPVFAGISGESLFKCSCTVKKQATENKR